MGQGPSQSRYKDIIRSGSTLEFEPGKKIKTDDDLSIPIADSYEGKSVEIDIMLHVFVCKLIVFLTIHFS